LFFGAGAWFMGVGDRCWGGVWRHRKFGHGTFVYFSISCVGRTVS
jgi:hypothetical protein